VHTIRPFRSGDLDAIVAIERQSFSDPWSQQMFEESIAASAQGLVADVDGAVVGYALIRTAADEAELLTIAIEPAHRRCGMARDLVVQCVVLCRNHRVNTLYLEVRASNDAAQHLYQSMGFRASGRRKNYYDEPTEDAMVMSYQIKD
jgi:[ribosomal protein S18]-alanine N-acetyltransferase